MTLIKQLLRERLLTKDDKDIRIISEFVNFAKEFLVISNNDVKVELAFERTPDIKTTAYYNIQTNLIKVYVKDRAVIDIIRSIGHELEHCKQNIEGRLTNALKDGEDGSELENEANAISGILVRKFGKLHPELYK